MKAGVLIVGNFFVSERGGRAVCEDLSERLERSGWRVSTTSWQASRPLRLLDMIATTWRGRRHFEIACVDVFSDAAFVWAEAVCLTLRLAAKPYMLALRGGNLPVFAAAHPRRVRRLLQSARCVIAPSAYLRDAMRPYRDDLVLQPNPIDLAAYPFRLRDRPQPHLVWIRAFHRIYNPVLAVAVLARVVREYPEARLSMIGPDKGDGTLDETKRAAADAGLSNRIDFVGPVPKSDVGRRLSRADVFLNTANVDNAPVTVLEAMACGLPVVTTDVGGLPQLVSHGRDALLVAADDPISMADSVLEILRTPVLAASLSREARRTAAASDWTDQLPRWERLLTSVIAGGSTRPLAVGSVGDA